MKFHKYGVAFIFSGIAALLFSCSESEDDKFMRLGSLELNNQLKVQLCWTTPISCGVKVNAPITPFTSVVISTDIQEIEKCQNVHGYELMDSQYDYSEEKICDCDALFSLEPNTTYYIRVLYRPHNQGKPTLQWQKGEILTVTTPSDNFWGEEIVDMGNNHKWRNRNVGADSPSECGSYYIWGTTEPVKFDASTHSYFPLVPNIYLNSICGTKYDAATVNLGEDWEMPTYSDVYDLLNSCTITKIWADKILYDFKSKITGSHLYLPASAYGAYIVSDFGSIKSVAELDNEKDKYIPFFWIGNMADNNDDYQDCLKGDKISIIKRYYSLPIRPIYIGK